MSNEDQDNTTKINLDDEALELNRTTSIEQRSDLNGKITKSKDEPEYTIRSFNVTKYYESASIISRKKTKVLDDVNFNVKKGEIYGLLGPSGCGKTTLLKCVIGLLQIDEGTLLFSKELKTNCSKYNINTNLLGFMPQENCVINELKLGEMFYYFGKLYLMSDRHIKERQEMLFDLLELPSSKNFVSSLSGGQLRRASLGLSLMNKPCLLMLDEPTVGLDPLLRKKIWNYLLDLSVKERTSIIITTHYIEETRRAHRLGFMRRGHIIEENTPNYFINKYNQNILEEIFYAICIESQTNEFIRKNSAVQKTSTVDVNNNRGDDQKNLLSSPSNDIKEDKISKAEPVRKGVEIISQDYIIKKGNQSIGSKRKQVGNCVKTSLNNRFGMSRARLAANFYKDFLKTKRNYKLLFVQFIVPIIQITFFCLCIGRKPERLPVGTINFDRDLSLSVPITENVGDIFFRFIDNSTINQIQYTDFDMAHKDLLEGKLSSIIKVDKGFTQNLADAYDDESAKKTFTNIAHVFMDMTNQQIAFTIKDAILMAVKDTTDLFLDEKRSPIKFLFDSDKYSGIYEENVNEKNLNITEVKAKSQNYPFIFEKPVYGSMYPLYIDFMAPGIALSILYFLSVGSTATNFEIERQSGVLQRSNLAGVKTIELLISQLVIFSVVMLIQVFIVLGLLFGVFQMKLSGSIILIIALVFSEGFCGLCFGLFIASVFEGVETILQITLASFYPILLMSGVIWPLEAQPRWLMFISKFSPITYPAEALRNILEKQWGLEHFQVSRGFIVIYSWTIIYSIVFLYFFSHKNKKIRTLC